MTLHFLLATGNPGFRHPATSPIRHAIKLAYGRGARVTLLPNNAEAVLRHKAIRTASNVVLVLDAQLPRAAGQQPDAGETSALNLLQTLRRDRAIWIPTVVITSRPMGVSEIDNYCSPENKAIALPLHHLEARIFKGFVDILQNKLQPPQKDRGKDWTVIEIEVQPTSTSCSLYSEDGPIKWGEATLARYSSVQSLAYEYAMPPKAQGWSRRIHRDGAQLFRELVISTLGPGLFEHLELAAGGLRQLKFRFNINDTSLYTVPFEALVRQSAQRDSGTLDTLTQNPFVLVNAPITRRMKTVLLQAPTHPAGVPRPARILFIRSQVGENREEQTGSDIVSIPDYDQWTEEARPNHLEFRSLRQIDTELNDLIVLRDKTKAFELDLLNLSGVVDAEGARRALRDGLADKSYDVVHFAGHSLTTKDGLTRLVLPSDTPGEAAAIPVQEFAEDAAASGARLIYLSSCHGSSANAVASFAQLGVPHVLGFRWVVEDHRAAQFARLFYAALFGSREPTICEAFRAACSGVYPREEMELSPIWASPILAAQADNWMAQRIL